MYNLDLFVISIYCFIEDGLYPAFCQANGNPRRAGFDPGLSDAECLTIEIVGHFLGYSSQKKLYEQMREHFTDWFPALKDRPAFVRQSANLWHVKVWMQQMIVSRLQGHQAPCQIIDTLPCRSVNWQGDIRARFLEENLSLSSLFRQKASVQLNKKRILALRRTKNHGLWPYCPRAYPESLWARQELPRGTLGRHDGRYNRLGRCGLYRFGVAKNLF